MTKEEKLLREYFKFGDVNEEVLISVLPLTLIDMLLEYGQIAPDAVKECKSCVLCVDYCDKKKFKVSVNATWCPDFERSEKAK